MIPAAFMEEHRDTDQVFSYYHGDSMLHFNTSLLSRIHKRVPSAFARITMDITEAEYNLCMVHRGIEEEKVARLRGAQLREPGLGALFDNGSFSIIDGHHRLVRRYRGGIRTMDFYCCASSLWTQCLVHYPAEYEAMIAETIPPRVEHKTDLFSHVKVHK